MAEKTAQIAEWQERAKNFTATNLKALEGPLGELDAHLMLRSHIVGYAKTDADTAVWKTIRENRVAHAYVRQNLMVNLGRWFKYIEEVYPQEITLPTRPAKTGKDEKARDEGGSFDIGLQDTSKGVVTRFPPEPS